MIAEAFLVAALAVAPADKPVCRNDLAVTLADAGFTGRANRIAWSIVMRESRGQNLAEDSPWFSGALGIWQVQTSAHADKAWWSRDAMLDPAAQSRIVYRYMTDKGRHWQPWGISPDGRSMDTTAYSGWSSETQWALIWQPYQEFWAAYPKGCRR